MLDQSQCVDLYMLILISFLFPHIGYRLSNGVTATTLVHYHYHRHSAHVLWYDFEAPIRLVIQNHAAVLKPTQNLEYNAIVVT